MQCTYSTNKYTIIEVNTKKWDSKNQFLPIFSEFIKIITCDENLTFTLLVFGSIMFPGDVKSSFLIFQVV